MDPATLFNEGWQLAKQGQYQGALQRFQQAAAAYEFRGDRSNSLNCRCAIGQMLHVQGKYAEAERALRDAAAEARKLDDPLTRCNAYRSLGDVLRAQGKYKEAERALRDAATEARKLDDPLTRCNASRSLGDVLRAQGKCKEAERALRDAVTEAEKLDDPMTRCNAFLSLGNVLGVQGKDEEAERALRDAATEAEKLDDPMTRSNAFRSLGDVLGAQGKYEEAERALRDAATEAEKLDDPLTRCNAFDNLGKVLGAQGKYEEAERALRDAATEARKLDDPLTRCRAFVSLGIVLSVQGKYEEAEQALRDAAAEAEKLEDPLTRCNAFDNLGDVLRAQGKYEEAERALRDAATEARKLDDPLTGANVAQSLGYLAADRGDWSGSLPHLTRSFDRLFAMLGANRWPDAVGNVMATYAGLFDTGLGASEQCATAAQSRGARPGSPWLGRLVPALRRWLGHPIESADPLWLGLAFVDGSKCVAIREGLRRHGRRAAGGGVARWQSAPADWKSLFKGLAPTASTVSGGQRRAAVRGVRGFARGGASTLTAVPTEPNSPMLELPGEIDEAKGQFCKPIDREGIATLLSDRETVLVNFYWQKDDLVVLPVRQDAAGQPDLLHTPRGYFRVAGVLPRITELAKQHAEILPEIVAYLQEENPHPTAAELVARFGPVTELYERLHRLLELDELLDLIEPDPARRLQLHLVLIPDGPLYGLPLHAACRTATAPRLYQQVASVRYGLSLRTLELQQQIQETRSRSETADRTLRGVVFANPDRDVVFLEGVIREVQALVEEAGPEAWWLHGEMPPDDQQAIRPNFEKRHRTGNIGWCSGHGDLAYFKVDARGQEVEVEDPAFLFCDDWLGLSQLIREGYDFSHWQLANFSCCLLGRLSILGRSREVMGYNAALTLLGCRRVASALWWLSDDSAPVFARFWIRAIKRHVFAPTPPGPHAFALAFKEALDGLRKFESGRFDYEFFWAPYTLYGLG